MLLKLTGDWQKFKGEDAPPPLKVKEPKAARPEIGTVFAESDKANEDGKGSATTPKKRAPKKDDKAAEKAAEPAAPAAEA